MNQLRLLSRIVTTPWTPGVVRHRPPPFLGPAHPPPHNASSQRLIAEPFYGPIMALRGCPRNAWTARLKSGYFSYLSTSFPIDIFII